MIGHITLADIDLNTDQHRTNLCPQCHAPFRVGQAFVQAARAVRPMHLSCRERFITQEQARLLKRLGDLGNEARALKAERAALTNDGAPSLPRVAQTMLTTKLYA